LTNVIETEFVSSLSSQIQALWQDPGIVKTWERRNEVQITDSAKYFFENIARISNTSYLPSVKDCLFCHARTTGIIETTFEYQSMIFKMVDVGGQRSERKKWIHCFENVTAVLFCVALSEYDQRLYEDSSVNRMMESIILFEQTCQTKWFENAAMILFLNKRDLFEEKITKKDMKICFSDYQGGSNAGNALQFIQHKFEQSNKTPKLIYTHVTTATETENVRFVFNAITDMIITQRLSTVDF
jgi:GTPase SAR1 family protein